MLRGLAAVVGQAAITAVVNTGDDLVLHGLYVSPDIDTVTYTLAGASNDETGWGLAGESWTVMGSLQQFNDPGGLGGADLTWFNLGDRDLATHLFRTGRLAAGATLSQVTAEVAHRFGVAARLLPMSDSPVETRVTVELRRSRATVRWLAGAGRAGRARRDRFGGDRVPGVLRRAPPQR